MVRGVGLVSGTRVYRGYICIYVYWARLFSFYYGALAIISVFGLTEPKNRINPAYFGYLELGTKFGTEIFDFG